jgi:hypothetical protein
LAVSVEAKRKPKVHSVQEAAARTAASTPAAQEDLDISGWLETGPAERTPARPEPPSAHETIADKSLVDTATMPAEGPKPDEQQSPDKKQQTTHGPSKGVGKFHAPAKRKAESSGAAADDALRQFFHRKK